jgi:hypothetical protein
MCTYTNKWLSNTGRAGPCRGKIDFCLKLMALNLSKETWSFLFWWSCDTMNNTKTHCTGWFWTHFQTKSSGEQCWAVQIHLPTLIPYYATFVQHSMISMGFANAGTIKKHTHCRGMAADQHQQTWSSSEAFNQPISNPQGRALCSAH